MKKVWIPLVFVIGLILTGLVVFNFYSYIFAKSIEGQVLRVERVGPTETIISGNSKKLPDQFFSFAIALRDGKGEIHTGSTEDRQWAVVQVGQCAGAKFLPYPPWLLDKSGTYYGVRLIRLYECPGAKATPSPSPSLNPTPTSS